MLSISRDKLASKLTNLLDTTCKQQIKNAKIEALALFCFTAGDYIYI
jgi:hypothetical protein